MPTNASCPLDAGCTSMVCKPWNEGLPADASELYPLVKLKVSRSASHSPGLSPHTNIAAVVDLAAYRPPKRSRRILGRL